MYGRIIGYAWTDDHWLVEAINHIQALRAIPFAQRLRYLSKDEYSAVQRLCGGEISLEVFVEKIESCIKEMKYAKHN